MKRSGSLFHSNIDVLVLIILVAVNLGMNLDHFFDPLDSFNAMQYFPRLQRIIAPGGLENPLVILGKQFTPIKLFIRSLSVGLLLLYIAFSFINLKNKSLRLNLKATVLFLLVFLLVIFPTFLTMKARWGGPHHELAHDGGTIQVEEAVKMILRGQNPYKETYHGTPLENWRGFMNLAVFHYPYFPFSFLASIPFYGLGRLLWGGFDQRVIYIFYHMGSLAIAWFLFRKESSRLAAAAWIGLNPFIARYFPLGVNDTGPVFWILCGLLLLRRNYLVLAFTCFALACGVKQFALFLIPFLFIMYFRIWGNPLDARERYMKTFGVWAITLGIVVLPFFLWSPVNFIEDVFLYSSGGLKTSYPIQGFHGFGFATFLLYFRLIPDGNVYFPFWILQFMFLIPAVILLSRRIWRKPRLDTALHGFWITLFIFMYFSRYLHGNFLGFILCWPLPAFLYGEEASEE